MRSIHLAPMDKTRPVLVLTREDVLPYRRWVTVAPIKTLARGCTTEVAVGRANGLDHDSVVDCDAVTTIERSELGKLVGYFFGEQEAELTAAITAAFLLH